MKLYSYWQSTTAYRIRIALHLKGLSYEHAAIDLTKGEQLETDYAELNPIMGVPTLVTDDGAVLTQSMAILTYLENIAPSPSIFPTDPLERARVEAAAQIIASDIHPVNNLKIRKRLGAMGHEQPEIVEWMNHWMAEGLSAYQALIRKDTLFSFGDEPSLADICLIPQLFNAHRWKLNQAPIARLFEIEAAALKHPAFEAANPNNQPDAI